MQRRVAELVLRIEYGAAFDQNRDDREIAVHCGVMKPGTKLIVGLVRIAAGGDELSDASSVVLRRCARDILPVITEQIDIGTRAGGDHNGSGHGKRENRGLASVHDRLFVSGYGRGPASQS